MKKTTIIRFLKITALALPVLLFVLFSQQYLFYYTDHNAERVRRFYQEEENSLDVVFLGASDVFSGFAPALAYDEYGFTSYMYAIDANPGALYKYQLKEVLRTQRPRQIFVEINGFLYDQPVEEERLSIMTDNIPLSLNKLETIWRFKEEDKLAGLFPFVVYHGDWEQGGGLLDRLEWRLSTSRHPSLLKGMVTRTTIDRRLPEEIEISAEQQSAMNLAENALTDFLNFCKEEKLDNIVFVRFPHKNADKHKTVVDQIESRVQEYGYALLNLEEKKEDMDLDVLQDYYGSEHLNIYGQRKLTSYLGKYIVEEIGVVPAEQLEENRLHWENCVAYYHGFYEYAQEKIEDGIEEWPCEDILTFPAFLEWMDRRPA